jgi:prevent-host-death family protein
MTASHKEIAVREVGAFEAKNKLSELLDLAERGEEVVITRHGKEVARLVPPHPAYSVEEARAAMQRIRERAKARGLKVTLEELKEWRDEGKR